MKDLQIYKCKTCGKESCGNWCMSCMEIIPDNLHEKKPEYVKTLDPFWHKTPPPLTQNFKVGDTVYWWEAGREESGVIKILFPNNFVGIEVNSNILMIAKCNLYTVSKNIKKMTSNNKYEVGDLVYVQHINLSGYITRISVLTNPKTSLEYMVNCTTGWILERYIESYDAAKHPAPGRLQVGTKVTCLTGPYKGEVGVICARHSRGVMGYLYDVLYDNGSGVIRGKNYSRVQLEVK